MKKEIKYFVGDPNQRLSIGDIMCMIGYAKDMLTDISVIDHQKITDFSIHRFDEDYFIIRFDYEGDENDKS